METIMLGIEEKFFTKLNFSSGAISIINITCNEDTHFSFQSSSPLFPFGQWSLQCAIPQIKISAKYDS